MDDGRDLVSAMTDHNAILTRAYATLAQANRDAAERAWERQQEDEYGMTQADYAQLQPLRHGTATTDADLVTRQYSHRSITTVAPQPQRQPAASASEDWNAWCDARIKRAIAAHDKQLDEMLAQALGNVIREIEDRHRKAIAPLLAQVSALEAQLAGRVVMPVDTEEERHHGPRLQ